jgi:hypothetical protein
VNARKDAKPVDPTPMLAAELTEAVDMVEQLALQGMPYHSGQYSDLALSTYEEAAEFLQRHRPERWQVTIMGMRCIDGTYEP